jgi:hypothetical protein
LVADLSPEDPIRELAKSVGRLELGGRDIEFNGICTAFIVSPQIILTSYHCYNAFRKKEAWFRLGYFSPVDTGQAYRVDIEPLSYNEWPGDFMFLRVVDKLPPDAPPLQQAIADPVGNEGLFILHHPDGRPMRLTRLDCQTTSNPINGADLRHVCDTMHGSSGAPIFAQAIDSVVGVQYLGALNEATDSFNSGKRIASILELDRKSGQAMLAAIAPTGELETRPPFRPRRRWQYMVFFNEAEEAGLTSRARQILKEVSAQFQRDQVTSISLTGVYPLSVEGNNDEIMYQKVRLVADELESDGVPASSIVSLEAFGDLPTMPTGPSVKELRPSSVIILLE